MVKEKYTFIGEHIFNEMLIVWKGNIGIEPINMNGTYSVNGKIRYSKENEDRTIKGYVNIEITSQDDLDDRITMILAEYPLKDGPSNIIHHMERRFPKKYRKEVFTISGRYLGESYRNVMIDMDPDLFDDFEDKDIAAFVLSTIDFDDEKGFPIRMDLESMKNQNKYDTVKSRTP